MKKKSIQFDATMYADFETTVSGKADQTSTEVWSAAFIYKGVENEPDNVHVLHSIDEFMEYLDELIYNTRIYFHNLKFDGSFILTYLLSHKQYKEAGHDVKPVDLKKHQFNYMISSKGIWYSITFRNAKNYVIQIWDSLKLAPMSLKVLGKSFGTKHQKLEMEYKGDRYAGCPISDEELAYIKNDVLVLKEVMEILNSEGVDAMTIGSACLTEFKRGYTYNEYKELFPDLSKIGMEDIDAGEERFSHDRSVDDFIRRSYHGGFCYVNPKYQGKIIHGKISHVDANSHYPSMMHSQSGNYYPVGEPEYVKYENMFNLFRQLKKSECFYYVRFMCTFKLKPNRIPSVQLKYDPRFKNRRNEWLTDSNNCTVDLVMSRPDYERFIDAYEIYNYEYIEAIVFHVQIGLFDNYINHWYSIKQNAKGAQRQIAKLFLNNLYGKFSASPFSPYKTVSYVPGQGLKYHDEPVSLKKAGYIAIGSAITAYARCRTIELAEDYYEYYMYSDTDSNVYCLPKEKLKKIPQHDSALCCWKVESESDEAVFVRQKTYYEHIIKPEPSENLKCCGMSDTAKNNFLNGLHDGSYQLSDFSKGLEVTGNLRSKNIDGGVLLLDTTYKMR